MDTTSSTIVGGSTPDFPSLSPDGLPLVLPSDRGRTFPTMGGGRTHNLDGDWKDRYLESHFLSQVWADCHRNDLYLLWPNGVQISTNHIFQYAKLCVPEDRLEGVLMALHVEIGHPGIDRLVLAAKARYKFPPYKKILTGCV